MKRFVFLLWMTALLSCLTLVAHADVIVGPVLFVAMYWPWILVAIVVFITWRILRWYRKN